MAAGRPNPTWLRLLVVALFFLSCAAWVSGFMTGELKGLNAVAALTLPYLFWHHACLGRKARAVDVRRLLPFTVLPFASAWAKLS
ncbi:hypothetical protein MAUB1S_10579 [Mycolicibacterium aubagnense]